MWLLFAFLVSIVVATGVFAAWQAERANRVSFTYDGVVIAIGALASVPVQIAMLGFAARLRHWTPVGLFRDQPAQARRVGLRRALHRRSHCRLRCADGWRAAANWCRYSRSKPTKAQKKPAGSAV